MFKRSHRGHGVLAIAHTQKTTTHTHTAKKVAHDSFVRPPARSSYDILLRTFLVVVDRAISLFTVRTRSARGARSPCAFIPVFCLLISDGSFFSTDNQLHLYAMFVYVFVSCRMSHRFVTHKASALYLCDSLHAIIYHNFYSACSCEHHDV